MNSPFFFAQTLLLFPVALTHAGENSPRPNLDVSIETVESRFVLGEIVKLNVKVRNLDAILVPAWELNDVPEMGIWISSDGKDYKLYSMGLPINAAERELLKILPGESLMYRVQILTSLGRDADFAFREGPGDYWIKARYPLRRPKLPNDGYDTEPVKIKVSPPTGEDEDALATIQQLPFLQYLQFGAVPSDHQDLPLKALELLEKYPDCSYNLDLRNRVMQAYLHVQFRTQGKIFQSEQLERAEKILGINSQVMFSHFSSRPRDSRLERMIHYEYRKLTNLQNVLEEMTRKGGVPLKLDDSLKRHNNFRSNARATTLRDFMQSVIDPGRTTWVRDGHAYILQPVETTQAP